MILPDVNVLIYAFRQGVPQHEVCRRWLDRVVGDETRFGISPLSPCRRRAHYDKRANLRTAHLDRSCL